MINSGSSLSLFALLRPEGPGGPGSASSEGVSAYYCHIVFTSQYKTAVVDWHYVNTTEFNWSESESLCLKET